MLINFFQKSLVGVLLVSFFLFSSSNVMAVTLEELAEKLDKLSQENEVLRKKVEALEGNSDETKQEIVRLDNKKSWDGSKDVVKLNHGYSYKMLDPTTNRNRKQRFLLEQKQEGVIESDSVYFGGSVTAIADYQKSNTEGKFGYLMRHPTSSNQRTKEVSEAVIHSSQLNVTGNLGDWITAYAEVLYDPEQSFGGGTITDLNRNQLQLRRGYVLLGDLDKSPLYLSLGKMDTPFGLSDTVNPFTASTVWHAFGGLAYGINAGYSKNGFNANLMAVQGGAQFRGANTPVDDSSVPSKLNNFAVDMNYTLPLSSDRSSLMLGASYIKGSAYCHEFPVIHFDDCNDRNGAYDIYGQLKLNNFLLQAEYAETEDRWPGTFNPTIPQFRASKVSSWDIGAKYSTNIAGAPTDFSIDFSRFVSGPDGSPWEKQDQIVLGASVFMTPSAKFFGEIIRTEGYVPLNFISGGNLGPGVTHSDDDATSNILLFGTNVAF